MLFYARLYFILDLILFSYHVLYVSSGARELIGCSFSNIASYLSPRVHENPCKEFLHTRRGPWTPLISHLDIRDRTAILSRSISLPGSFATFAKGFARFPDKRSSNKESRWRVAIRWPSGWRRTRVSRSADRLAIVCRIKPCSRVKRKAKPVICRSFDRIILASWFT